MKHFLIKHKWSIIVWIVFAVLILYFAPKQHDYYLDDDVKNFKQTYLLPFLIVAGFVFSVIMLFVAFAKSRSIKQAGISFLAVAVYSTFFILFFNAVILGIALFINRQFTNKSVERKYIANYLAGTGELKANFFPFELSTNRITVESKLRNKLFRPGLKQNDTIRLQFQKGIFGILFQAEPLTK